MCTGIGAEIQNDGVNSITVIKLGIPFVPVLSIFCHALAAPFPLGIAGPAIHSLFEQVVAFALSFFFLRTNTTKGNIYTEGKGYVRFSFTAGLPLVHKSHFNPAEKNSVVFFPDMRS